MLCRHKEGGKMSSDAQVFAASAEIQHQAQRAGLRWLEKNYVITDLRFMRKY